MREPVLETAGRLRRGEVTSVELTERYIAAIERDNPKLNAYVHLTFDEARRAARAADLRLKEGNASLLCGIPMTLKDNISTKGELTTCCSCILEGYRPFYDATVWEKLKRAGAVLLGKTNMDEFAMGSACETGCYGAALNPVDPTRVPGGSSGGGASAVGGDLAAYAIGSDTGGSIRQPAAFCGLVGLKPTYGAVSRYGLIAYGSSLDQIGPITKSVRDAAAVYDALFGADPRDGTSEQAPYADTLSALDGEIGGLKIGVAKEYFDGLPSEISSAVLRALHVYEKMGAELVELSIPALKLALPAYYIIACAEASSNLGRYDGIRYGKRAETYKDVNEMISKTRTERFGKEVRRRIMLGTYVLSSGYYDAYYKKACALRETISAEFDKVFERCDVMIAPSAPNTAFPLGYTSANPIETYLSDVCTVPVNIAGLPAISLPCGRDGAGLPIGMQLIGKKFSEPTTLNAAYAFERESGFDQGGDRA